MTYKAESSERNEPGLEIQFVREKRLFMITIEHRKELFSYSYLCAIAAQAGSNLSLGDSFFDYGIDATFKEVLSKKLSNGKEKLKQSGISFEAQIKCTKNLRSLNSVENHFSFDLNTDNYNDLVIHNPGTLPKILIVVGVPEIESERLSINTNDELMTLKNLAYWANLAGENPTSNSGTKVVLIPKINTFTPVVINKFFECIKNQERLNA